MTLKSLFPGVLPLLLLSGVALASPLAATHGRGNGKCDGPHRSGTRAVTSTTPVSDGACGVHGPSNRGCWQSTFNVDTDFEQLTPTGVTRNVCTPLAVTRLLRLTSR